QLVELRVVVPAVAGSSPVRHPLRTACTTHENACASDSLAHARRPEWQRLGSDRAGSWRLDAPLDLPIRLPAFRDGFSPYGERAARAIRRRARIPDSSRP